MPTPLVVNGTTYQYPTDQDPLGWGAAATSWATAVTNSMLQLSGGNFPLTADVNFGSSFGILAQYYTTRSSNPASTGNFRLASQDTIKWRNNANGADLSLTTDSSDNLLWNGTKFVQSNGLLVTANLIEGFTSTATAAGTTTLTVTSNYQQVFTGSTTQTVTLPVAATLTNGQAFLITNLSSGTVTVQTSGSNTIQAMGQNTQLLVTCVNNAGGTGTASWNWNYTGVAGSTLPISLGGTGQTTATAAFDALSPLTTQGDVPYYNGTHNTRLGVGTNGQALTTGGSGANPSWTTFDAYPENLILNSAFDFWQRYGASPSQTIAINTKTYVPDRFYGYNNLGGSGVITLSQQTGSVNGSLWQAQSKITTGGSQNGCEFWTVLDNLTTMRLYGQTASVSAWVGGLNHVNSIKMWVNYGTSEAKLTSASSNITSATISVTPAASNPTMVQITINNISIGTSMTTAGVIGIGFSVNGVSSGNTWDVNNGICVEQVMLNLGSVVGPYRRATSNPQQELSACQRYYEKSYDLTTAPGASSTTAGESAFQAGAATSGIGSSTRFQVMKRITGASVTLYSPSTGTSGKVFDLSGSADLTASATTVGMNGFTITYGGTTTDAHLYTSHFSVDADI